MNRFSFFALMLMAALLLPTSALGQECNLAQPDTLSIEQHIFGLGFSSLTDDSKEQLRRLIGRAQACDADVIGTYDSIEWKATQTRHQNVVHNNRVAVERARIVADYLVREDLLYGSQIDEKKSHSKPFYRSVMIVLKPSISDLRADINQNTRDIDQLRGEVYQQGRQTQERFDEHEERLDEQEEKTDSLDQRVTVVERSIFSDVRLYATVGGMHGDYIHRALLLGLGLEFGDTYELELYGAFSTETETRLLPDSTRNTLRKWGAEGLFTSYLGGGSVGITLGGGFFEGVIQERGHHSVKRYNATLGVTLRHDITERFSVRGRALWTPSMDTRFNGNADYTLDGHHLRITFSYRL